MDATTLYRAGRLDEAIAALGQRLRDEPTDLRSRTFLFELLCFAGQHDRAEKHLDLLSSGGADAEMGAWLYRSAVHADRVRLEMFRAGSLPVGSEPRPVSGTLNGKPFESLEDADPRIGARLEVFAAGAYQWIPFELLSSVRIGEPKKLRDLLWITGTVTPAGNYRGGELGEALLPVLTPLTCDHAEGTVRLGQETRWEEDGEGSEIPYGQKVLLVDGEDVPFLEVRELLITPPSQEDG